MDHQLTNFPHPVTFFHETGDAIQKDNWGRGLHGTMKSIDPAVPTASRLVAKHNTHTKKHENLHKNGNIYAYMRI